MTETIIVAILSFTGTAIGSVVSILTANKLTNYKIDELAKKVEKHNNVIERVYRLEQDEAVIMEKIAVANHRIQDLETNKSKEEKRKLIAGGRGSAEKKRKRKGERKAQK